MKTIQFLIIVFILSFIVINTQAQNETGTRYLNKEIFQIQGNWLDSTTEVFQEKFPIIRTIPPLNTSMPYDVRIGYIYLDSLLRFGDKHTYDSLYNYWNSLNDTLTGALKYLYIINDYDPAIFNQYANEVKFYHHRDTTGPKMYIEYNINDDSTYIDSTAPTVGPFNLYLDKMKWKLCEKFRNIYTGSRKLAYYSMLYSDIILRVKVIAIDSMKEKNTSLDYFTYRVKSIILDTLKGQILPIDCEPDPLKMKKEKFQSSCYFYFQYTHQLYGMSALNPMPYETWLYPQEDTAFKDWNEFSMKVNQEVVIFIKFNDPKFDFENDYFDLCLEPRCSYNALRIENDTVYDINNVWSDEVAISYPEWKQIYLNLLNNIKNLDY